MNEYTVTIAGPERHDGEKPYDFLIDAATPEEAAAAAMRAHICDQEDDPDFNPDTPGSDGTPSYLVLAVVAGRPGARAVFNDIRGTTNRPAGEKTVRVGWATTTITEFEVSLPVSTVRKILTLLGYDPDTTDAISQDVYDDQVHAVLAAHEWPTTTTREYTDSRSLDIDVPLGIQA